MFVVKHMLTKLTLDKNLLTKPILGNEKPNKPILCKEYTDLANFG